MLKESQFSLGSLQSVPETPQARMISKILDEEYGAGTANRLMFKSPLSSQQYVTQDDRTECTEIKIKPEKTNI